MKLESLKFKKLFEKFEDNSLFDLTKVIGGGKLGTDYKGGDIKSYSPSFKMTDICSDKGPYTEMKVGSHTDFQDIPIVVTVSGFGPDIVFGIGEPYFPEGNNDYSDNNRVERGENFRNIEKRRF